MEQSLSLQFLAARTAGRFGQYADIIIIVRWAAAGNRRVHSSFHLDIVTVWQPVEPGGFGETPSVQGAADKRSRCIDTRAMRLLP